ncbi:hypothetical protein [Streptomyces sp. NPDC005498]|uniref:hypothetical protein n=1 Tax=Streptomyces sp. NPDC005498 TaxID=3364717 RepID=UPI0036D030BC
MARRGVRAPPGGPSDRRRDGAQLPQALAGADVVASGIAVDIPDGDAAASYRTLRLPYLLGEVGPYTARRPPEAGEHTAEVLAEAGCTPEEIARLGVHDRARAAGRGSTARQCPRRGAAGTAWAP